MNEFKARIKAELDTTKLNQQLKQLENGEHMSYIISNQDSPENMSALVNYIKNNQDNPDAMSAMLSYIKKAQQSPDGKKAAVDYIKKNQGNPTDKSAKVNYVKGTQERPSVMSTIVNYITGGKKYNGTVHYNGTVNNNYIDSNAFGNWGIAKDETSLVNELGKEVIVRNGKPFTVNNGYPAITHLKKGDIIFNHEQTKELLEKGYALVRDKKIKSLKIGKNIRIPKAWLVEYIDNEWYNDNCNGLVVNGGVV